MMNNGLVRFWMTTPVVTVPPDTSLADARKILNERQIRSLPIVDNGELVGIVTRRGLLRLDFSLLDDAAWASKMDVSDKKVSSVMTGNPLTILPGSLMPKAARVMLENKITALPVVESGKLAGILTNSDLMRFILEEYPTLKKKILVEHYMTDEVVTVEPDASLLEAHRLMGIKRIRTLPVLKDEKLAGLVTRTDLMSSDPSRIVSKNHQEISLKVLLQPVEKVMTKNLITISRKAQITEAARLMLENKIHCLPVLDADQKLAGIITESDLFLMIVQKFF
jgi:CBS domain-containing protein